MEQRILDRVEELAAQVSELSQRVAPGPAKKPAATTPKAEAEPVAEKRAGTRA